MEIENENNAHSRIESSHGENDEKIIARISRLNDRMKDMVEIINSFTSMLPGETKLVDLLTITSTAIAQLTVGALDDTRWEIEELVSLVEKRGSNPEVVEAEKSKLQQSKARLTEIRKSALERIESQQANNTNSPRRQ